MKTWLMAALMAVVAVGFMPTPADAKRFGGGGFSGMNRNMPARTAPNAPPPKQPAAPAQTTPAQAAPGAAAAAPAAAAGRSWMGPIAGLAAGLGIAALMSHLGLGEAFGNFLMLALLAVAAIFLVRFLMRRFAPAQQGRTQFAAAGAGAAGVRPAASPSAWAPAAGHAAPQPTALQPAADPAEPAVAEPAASAALPKVFVPATFDSEAFERVAKMIFIRMQAANDTADLNDLRSFTTPEMYAAVKLDLHERGNGAQHTDVVHVDAKVLDVAQEDERQVVSVRFLGQLREEDGGPLVDFDEVWHLVKPLDDSRSWAIAGIEQSH
jgi:predicted lipid-binding transport protein (Tim44 family)